jgi:hypothetical protein
MAALLATLTMLTIWQIVRSYPYIDPDSGDYQAMADGTPVMKPFAFRFLEPAAARLFADLTGSSTTKGFLTLGLISGWTLLYGVLVSVVDLERDRWLLLALIPLPFWVRNFTNYFLPDLFHAALCIIYLMLLRRRWWGWAAAMLAVMFLARESTVLIAAVAVPVLWWLAGRRVALIQFAGTLVGIFASKFATRHALANQHNINDTLYLIGKIPWNLSRNVFGLTLWTNTLQPMVPIRVWDIPRWLPLGSIHQVGYGPYDWIYQVSTAVQLLTSFGLGTCVALFLIWRTPLHKLLPREEPYLCVAAIYGALVFLLAPVCGATLARLFDYGWPLFLVYLPTVIPRVWRGWPFSIVSALLGMHLVSAWMEPIRLTFLHLNICYTLAVLVGCNLWAAWLLWKSTSTTLTPANSAILRRSTR